MQYYNLNVLFQTYGWQVSGEKILKLEMETIKNI